MNINTHIQKVYPELIKMCRTLTKCSDSSKDLVHDIIIDFLKKSTKRKEEIINDGRLKQYLYIACKTQYNSSNSTYHTNYRISQIFRYTEELNADDYVFNEEDVHNNDELRDIMVSINLLCNRKEKQLIADRFIENKTFKEIANKNNIPVYKTTETIKNIIHKLRVNLTN